jgi:hypothetical protein
MKKFLAFLIFGVIIIHYSFSDSHLIPTKKVVTESFDPTPEPESVGIKVALLLDTSNSMDGLIAQAKAQLWQIVNELSLAKYGGKNPHLKIALYEYGNDGLEQSDGYLRKVLDFGNDLDLISEKLFALKTNGGSEYCGTVIQKSLDELAWGKNEQDLNLIFIAGNEPFTQGNVSYKDATTNAKEKNVIVNTIFCGNYQEGINSFWQQGALLTGGDYSAIDHNVVQVYMVTPYDQQIIILNQQLNDTYIYYGNQGYQKLEMQKVQDDNAAQMSEAVIVNRAVSKSKAIYNNNSWDLVDASKEKDFDLKKIEKDDLPEELKSKTNAELESYIKEQTAKRADIQKQIDVLNVQRNQYLASQQKNDKTENLENAMLSTIRKQAENKRYTFE